MITRTPGSRQDWRTALRQAIRDPDSLSQALGRTKGDLGANYEAHRGFPTLIPPAWLHKIDFNNPNDPLLRQVLPTSAENDTTSGFTNDPVGDQAARRNGGVLHKYHGRALLITTGACAINCRYCFRRHFPYSQHIASRGRWEAACAYLEDHSDVTELILSGGDPLMLSTELLGALTEQLKPLSHIQTLRIHTRMPVVMPERIDDDLIDWIARWPGRLVVVIHSNHPNELGPDVAAALERLRGGGARLFNQSVLLKGVNDRWQTLARLSQSLFDMQVQPYYLHQLDRATGTAHFEVDQETAKSIVRDLMAHLPGYLVPKLVQESAGAEYKQPLL